MAGTSRKTGRRYGKWLIGLAILLLGITSLVVWMSRSTNLVIATKVVPRERFQVSQYTWLSNKEYVYVNEENHRIYRYHLQSGVSTELKGLIGGKSWAVSVEASPNGKWLLWRKQTPSGKIGNQLSLQTYLTDLDHMHTYQKACFSYAWWEPDSRHVLSVDYGNGSVGWKVEIFDAFENRISQTLPVTTNAFTEFNNAFVAAPDRLLELSYLPHNRRLMVQHVNDPLVITEYGVDKTFPILRKWLVSPPHGTRNAEIKISPTGDRIAWIVDHFYFDPWMTSLHRWMPRSQLTPHWRRELWISRLNGSEMREVEHAPVPDRNGDRLIIKDLRWLPDGKRVSFSYDSALWTAPVEP